MLRLHQFPILAMFLIASAAPAADVTGFTLINADSDSAIRALTDGDTIDFANLSTTNLNIRADVSNGTPGSVSFALSGAESHTQTESVAPFALFGDNSGDYNAWSPSLGDYTLTADSSDGASLSIAFSVTDSGSSGGGGGGSSDPADGDGTVTIAGDLMQWHRVDLTIAAVGSSELGDPNPFRHYRFNVIFTSPSNVDYVVPGYFATDGNGGDSGNLWRKHPTEPMTSLQLRRLRSAA